MTPLLDLIARHQTEIIGTALIFFIACGVVFLIALMAHAMWTDGDMPLPAVRSWKQDFGAWREGDISIDEFLDRRWSFRKLK